MSSRIEVELTSQKSADVWTWRAAGAKEPRGTVNSSLLYDGAKVGDVVRVDVTFEMEGIQVDSVLPPKSKKTDPRVVEIATKDPASFLTRTVSGRDRDRSRDSAGKAPRDRERKPRTDRNGTDRSDFRTSRSTATPRPKSEVAPKSTDAERSDKVRSRVSRPERNSQVSSKARIAPSRFKKLVPKNTNRAKTLEGIAPEHLPIAEQLLKGGIPAVRQALATQNEKAISEGKPTISEATILAIAEPMLPSLKVATWKDRAEAAIEIANEASLRDLRSVVSAADVIRHDESTRATLETLRTLTGERSETLTNAWLAEVKENLVSKRIIRAVRVSSRPPEPTAKLPAEVLQELTEAANEMMNPATPADRWSALIEALGQSPIRRQVKPVGFPDNAPTALVELAKENSGRIPALAALLGVAIPPPPRPRKKIVAASTSVDPAPQSESAEPLSGQGQSESDQDQSTE